MTSELDDLIHHLEQGDTTALQHLYEAFSQQVYSLAYAITQNRETAEEVTQDVFLKVWHKIEQYEAGTNFRAWLLQITRHQAIDRLRKDRRYQEQSVVWDMERLTAPSHFIDDTQRWIHRALLDYVSQEQRQAIELAFLRGYTHEQIAALLDTPLGTIKTRIRDGLQKLRDAMQKEGLV